MSVKTLLFFSKNGAYNTVAQNGARSLKTNICVGIKEI